MGNFFEKNSCLEKKDSAADAEENRENARSCRQKVLYAAGLAGGLYAVLRYLLPLVAPFVFAFFIVRILYPQLCRAEKRLRIRKDILMAGFLLLLTGILAAGFFFLLSKGTAWAVKIGSESGAIKDQVNIAFENGCCRAEELLGREQGEIRTFFQDKGDEMAKTVGREILPKAADWTDTVIEIMDNGSGVPADQLEQIQKTMRGVLAVQGLCAFFGMDEKERDLGKY